MTAGLTSCIDLGWSVSSGVDGAPDVGLYLNGGGFYGPPAPLNPPAPPVVSPWGGPAFVPINPGPGPVINPNPGPGPMPVVNVGGGGSPTVVGPQFPHGQGGPHGRFVVEPSADE